MHDRAILVTGSGGLLGRSLAALSTSERRIVALCRADLDITDAAGVGAALDRYQPSAVVNAAAMTDVDRCEREPDAARRANVEGPAVLARSCADRGIPTVHVSTDFVFDGRKTTPYTYLDMPNPVSVYGQTKYEGEQAVRAAAPGAIIARTSWVFGPGGKNFASRLLEFASKSSTLKGITDMCSLPTYGPDLAARLLELVAIGDAGIYHITGGGEPATWFDVARFALDCAGRTDVTVLPVTAAELGLPAPRPPYSVMTCILSRGLGLPELRDWRMAMAEFVRPSV